MNVFQIVEKLQQEQVVAYSTEAVFGLSCNSMSESAVEKLLILKNRPKKRLILIAPSLDYLLPFIDVEKLNVDQYARLQAEYDHPITWVVPTKLTILKWLTGQFESIALRICQHPAVMQLCEQAGFALTSTSANLSSLPPCRTVREVRSQFGENFPVLDENVGQAQNPSEIRDLLTGQLFREG